MYNKMTLVMKDFLKMALIISVIPIFFAACYEDGDKKIEYYLSQPKDTALVGWWKWSYDDENDIQYFWKFKQTGTITQLVFRDSKFDYDEDLYYWYTEKKGDKNILYTFHKVGVLYNHDEGRGYYKIVGDSLWQSGGIEGDVNSSELYFFGTKTDAPEGYE
jgi:hypothetical protein